jgi:hypothetical protein
VLTIVYGICAAVAGTIFLIQLVLSLAGHDGHDGSFDDPSSFDHPDHDSSGIFGVLSFRTVIAAFAFFGLAGLGGEKSGWAPMTTFTVAVLIGGAALYGVYWLGMLLHGLQSDETADPRRSVGCRGNVYLRIPAERGGVGKVQISQQGRTMEYEAVTRGQELHVGDPIVVVAHVGSDTVEVASPS